MSEEEKRDIREANRKISRDQQGKGTSAKVFAGRREEFALKSTGEPENDGERALEEASKNPDKKSEA